MDAPIPPPPKPSKKLDVREYRTAFRLVDQNNIDKQVYDMILAFGSNTRAFRHKSLWGQYAAFLYLSGARAREPFCTRPTISKAVFEGDTYYYIYRTVCKSFVGKRIKKADIAETNVGGRWKRRSVMQSLYQPTRKRGEQTFQALNDYEKSMFEFLLDGKVENTIDFIPLLQSRGLRLPKVERLQQSIYEGKDKIADRVMAEVTHKFSRMFHADITNGRSTYLKAGLTPHMMRHLRAYDLRVNEGVPDNAVRRTLFWTSREMLDYYTDIVNAMDRKSIIKEYQELAKRKR